MFSRQVKETFIAYAFSPHSCFHNIPSKAEMQTTTHLLFDQNLLTKLSFHSEGTNVLWGIIANKNSSKVVFTREILVN